MTPGVSFGPHEKMAEDFRRVTNHEKPSGGSHEKEFPEGADMKPPREFLFPVGTFLALGEISENMHSGR
jgi:hypothetical protein